MDELIPDPTPASALTGVVYADFWRRFQAYCFDATIIVTIAFLLDVLLPGNAQAQSGGMEDVANLLTAAQTGQFDGNMQDLLLRSLTDSMFGGSLLPVDKYIIMMTSAIYNIFFAVSDWQATPGKRWKRCLIVSDAGGRITLLQSVLRHAVSGLSMLPLGLGCLTIMWTRQKLAPHDMAASTRVIMRPDIS